ncbi:1447_t:CDS:1, partial [Scutellospora calospora]
LFACSQAFTQVHVSLKKIKGEVTFEQISGDEYEIFGEFDKGFDSTNSSLYSIVIGNTYISFKEWEIEIEKPKAGPFKTAYNGTAESLVGLSFSVF